MLKVFIFIFQIILFCFYPCRKSTFCLIDLIFLLVIFWSFLGILFEVLKDKSFNLFFHWWKIMWQFIVKCQNCFFIKFLKIFLKRFCWWSGKTFQSSKIKVDLFLSFLFHEKSWSGQQFFMIIQVKVVSYIFKNFLIWNDIFIWFE